MTLHKIVTAGSRQVVLVPHHAQTITIVPMTTAFLKIETQGHYGAIKLALGFVEGRIGDLKILIHNKQRMDETDNIWRFKDRKQMILMPKKAFDRSLLT